MPSGIYTSISLASSLGGGSVSFAVGDTSAGPLRVSDFTWSQRMVGDSPKKLQTHGNWPSFRDVSVMELQMEGVIVGADPTDYWAQRQALIKAAVPPPGYSRAFYEHGTLQMVLPGVGTASCLVNLVDWASPMAASNGSTSRYSFTWHADAGFWTVGGNLVVL
jgi:hypothetical protein